MPDRRRVPRYDLGAGLVGVGSEQFVYVGLPQDVEVYVMYDCGTEHDRAMAGCAVGFCVTREKYRQGILRDRRWQFAGPHEWEFRGGGV
eukprot:2856566-Alexandrium_andersonii.AAC.1